MPKKNSIDRNFDVVLPEGTYHVDVEEETSIDISSMNDELEKQPGKYAEFGMLYVLARGHFADAKRLKEVTYAELDAKIRQEARDAGTKITENAINQEIVMRVEYDEACTEFTDAETQMNRLKHMCIALDQRREMLLALNANIRKEMEGI